MLEDTLLAIHQVLEQLQGGVILASLNEARNLITARYEIAITFALQSTWLVEPESRSFLDVQDDGCWEICYSHTQLFGLYSNLGHSSESRRD